MDLEKAEALIKKYYKGETSHEEELQLKEFFRTAENIPEHLSPEKELFSMYSEAAREELPVKSLMENLEKVIDSRSGSRVTIKKPAVYWISGIAAGIALLLVSYFLIVQKPIYNKKYALQDTYQDPKLAYDETQKVLLYVSQQMNKGTAQLHNVSRINKPVHRLQNLKKIDAGMSQLRILQLIDNENSN
ncbi:MAG: hypothetical protein JW723_08385 [Bacteroidales bacterium]|nr:hypothetical protein [Bacteroidales bacterium]